MLIQHSKSEDAAFARLFPGFRELPGARGDLTDLDHWVEIYVPLALLFDSNITQHAGARVGQIETKDRANEFRVVITGKFAAGCVREVEAVWRSVLSEIHSRRFTVDISELSGFDVAGRKLLRDMYLHGAVFAAATPVSLVFLNEISARRRAATLMPEYSVEEAPETEKKPAQSETEPKPFLAARAAGAGSK